MLPGIQCAMCITVRKKAGWKPYEIGNKTNTLVLGSLDLKRRSAGVRTVSFCWYRLKSKVAQGGVASSTATGRHPEVRGVWWSSWSAEPANVIELCSILQEITPNHPAYRHNPRKCMTFASLTEDNLTMVSVSVQHQQHSTLPSPTLYMGNDNCDTPTYRTGSTLKISTGIGRAVAHASITVAVPSTTHHGL